MDGLVTVVIPVGPETKHRRYLDECLASVAEQTVLPREVLLIDDMAGLPQGLNHEGPYPIRTWWAPWRLGAGQAFNAGIALAETELVFMLGADDKLLPRCLEECVNAYEGSEQKDRWYGVGVRYSDGRPDQFLPCGAAMVTNGLWRMTGGFPPECEVGAQDAALLSILLGNWRHLPQAVVVNGQEPLYWYRVHDDSETATKSTAWQRPILQVRDLLTQDWKPPQWGRYA